MRAAVTTKGDKDVRVSQAPVIVKVKNDMSHCFDIVWLCPEDVVNDGVTDAINGFLLCIGPSKSLDTIGGTPHAVQHVDSIHTRNIQDF